MLLYNRQRRFRIDKKHFVDFVRRLSEATGQSEDAFSVTLVRDESIRDLNRRFRSKNYPTDVLSFPSKGRARWALPEEERAPRLGEIVISVETAKRQARREGHQLDMEIKLLMIHGLLHLMGFDHERDHGEMNRLEYRLRARLL